MSNLEIVCKMRNWQEVADYLNSVKSRALAERAKCAYGRLNCWLNAV